MKKKNLLYKIATVPHIVWMVLFIVAPLLFVVYYSFTDTVGNPTFASILSLADHLGTFGLSVSLAVIATAICLVVGYPMAYWIAKTSPKNQKILITLVMLPMWMNLLIRTYSMMAILDDGGFLNSFIELLGGSRLHIVGTSGAVVFGMVYNFLPYMVLPIYSVISKLDPSLVEASSDLGCSGMQTVFRVVIPLSISGIISGVTMVFVPSISTFYISQKLGGGTFDLIGDTIERQFQNPSTYNVGAAISLVMMILILISLAIMNKYSGDTEEGGIIV